MYQFSQDRFNQWLVLFEYFLHLVFLLIRKSKLCRKFSEMVVVTRVVVMPAMMVVLAMVTVTLRLSLKVLFARIGLCKLAADG